MMIRIKKESGLVCIIFCLALIFSSCRNKVTITRSYIYSTSWAKGDYQGFQIAKIRLKDSTLSVFDRNFNRYFLDKYTIDSSFCYGSGSNTSNIKETKRMPKIFFERESDNYIWYNCWNITETYKTIGLLELNTWYIIIGLHGTEDFYIYIDNDGGSHTYSLGPTNY